MMGVRHAAIAMAMLGGGITFPATATQAELWGGFYRSTAPQSIEPQGSAVPAVVLDDAVCIAEILEAQTRFGIPDNLLLAIGLQEAGRYAKSGLTVWPWTVNAGGEGVFFSSKKAMLDWVRARRAKGVRSIDVGCMQVNQKWHGNKFASLEQAGDPHANVLYAARYLRALFREEGDWWKAAGRYHSGTQQYQETYLNRLSRNLRVARAELDRFADRLVAQTAGLTQPALPRPPVFWGGATASVQQPDSPENNAQPSDYSIYSNQPIRPLLPGYTERF